jgi:DNA-binding NarL/FixJ family response regulator
MAAEAPIPVAILSSSPVIRSGLQALLEREPVLALVEAAEHADVAVIDRLPELRTSALASNDDHRLARVLLIGKPEEGIVARALRSGVRAVISADAPASEITAAILAVHAGLLVFPASLAESLIGASHVTAPAPNENSPLTPREREVLQLIGEGYANKTIAQRLGISEHTAKFHVSSVLGKLGVETRTEAVRLGIKAGLIAV